jgi:hypothetical protein
MEIIVYTVEVYTVKSRDPILFTSFVCGGHIGPCSTFEIYKFLQLSSSKFLSLILEVNTYSTYTVPKVFPLSVICGIRSMED